MAYLAQISKRLMVESENRELVMSKEMALQ